MQNAGEDTGTTVKSGGVYELGRIVYDGRNGYFGTSSASDLTVDAGGRATVYAGTLTGATVSGEDATLTLMTPQTETKDSDFTLSLTGNVSVTDHARLVAQRGADMSGADLTLGSQGTLILKGDTGCPEEGCSWTVKSLTLDNGEVAFYDTAAVSDGGYQSLDPDTHKAMDLFRPDAFQRDPIKLHHARSPCFSCTRETNSSSSRFALFRILNT